jgi:uncharacterized protein YdiU (UPF0061 family)
MLISGDEADVSFAPWSLRYSGHQFGAWAGQLGDGRATSIRTCLSLSSFRLSVRTFQRNDWSHRCNSAPL